MKVWKIREKSAREIQKKKKIKFLIFCNIAIQSRSKFFGADNKIQNSNTAFAIKHILSLNENETTTY